MTKKTASKKKIKKKSKKKDAKKAIEKLISKGKKQGYLTYDEINDVLPEDMLSLEQIDETFIIFDANDIEIIDEGKNKLAKKIKKIKEAKIKMPETSVSDFGTVTDPFKMYLREMGLVTLLSREGEVVIAKEIEAGEREILRELLDTTIGVKSILRLGDQLESGVHRPRQVLRDFRDVEDGDTYIDEALQIQNFLNILCSIRAINEENEEYREKLFSSI